MRPQAKDEAFREQQAILKRRRNPELMQKYEDEVATRRRGESAASAELRAVQAGKGEGDALDAWQKLKQEGKVLTTDTAPRDPDSARFGSEGLIAQRMDEQLPYIDQGCVAPPGEAHERRPSG